MATTKARRLQTRKPPPPPPSRFGRRLLVVLGTAAVLVVALIAAMQLTGGDDGGGDAGPVAPAEFLAGIPQKGNVLGEPDAPVTLVEYADFQCPFCGDWARDAFPEVVSQYVRDGRLKIEFRGLAFIGEDSEEALRAALAAGQQDHLFDVMHTFFERQGGENAGWVTDELVRNAAEAAGADVDALMDARDSDAVSEAIEEAAAQAQGDGIQATPTFLLGPTGGQLETLQLSGLDFAAIEPAIEDALAAAGG
jgi:protein-disulfide isomerase